MLVKLKSEIPCSNVYLIAYLGKTHASDNCYASKTETVLI